MTIISLRSKLSYSKSRTAPANFEIYYRHYLPKIFNYVSYRVRDQSIAEDLTATIFEKALKNFGHYSEKKGAFSTWLFTIARNVVANYLRGQSRSPDMTTFEAMPQVMVDDDTLSPEQTVIKAEQFRQVQRYLRYLDQREQEVIALKFGSDLRNQEIAQIMGLTPSHVGVLIHRTIGKLRKIFEEMD